MVGEEERAVRSSVGGAYDSRARCRTTGDIYRIRHTHSTLAYDPKYAFPAGCSFFDSSPFGIAYIKPPRLGRRYRRSYTILTYAHI